MINNNFPAPRKRHTYEMKWMNVVLGFASRVKFRDIIRRFFMGIL
jgi:hypothetical protein